MIEFYHNLVKNWWYMKKIKKIILIIILTSISIDFYFICSGYKMYKQAIQETPLTEKIKKIKAKKDYTNIEEMPKIYLTAVISTEDHRFYKHCGIDIISIGRAFINDIKNIGFVEGGSTITQQLAKNIYFTQDKTIQRKIAEIFMALNIEKHYKKNEILELYLNTSYFGHGYYSIKSASLGYFGKLPKNMNISESIMMAGILNAPSIYNPDTNKAISQRRQNQVINKMIKYGNLDKNIKNNLK